MLYAVLAIVTMIYTANLPLYISGGKDARFQDFFLPLRSKSTDMSTLFNIDRPYTEWITEISEQFRHSQIKAATSVNSEMLKFYWNLGREITEKKSQYQWGDKFFENLSHDLRTLLPGVKSFSATNLRYMQRFYLLYSKVDKVFPKLGKKSLRKNHKLFPKLGSNTWICCSTTHFKGTLPTVEEIESNI